MSAIWVWNPLLPGQVCPGSSPQSPAIRAGAHFQLSSEAPPCRPATITRGIAATLLGAPEVRGRQSWVIKTVVVAGFLLIFPEPSLFHQANWGRRGERREDF